jgi:hypothetical protein
MTWYIYGYDTHTHTLMMCVCNTHTLTHTHTHTIPYSKDKHAHTNTHTHIYMCVCVCVGGTHNVCRLPCATDSRGARRTRVQAKKISKVRSMLAFSGKANTLFDLSNIYDIIY